jgi:PAS domain S-box-containing protein
MFITKPDGAIVDANAAVCRLLGRSRDEIIRLGRDGVVDQTDANLQAGLREREQTGFTISKLRFIRKDGSKVEAIVTSGIFDSACGEKLTGIVCYNVEELRDAVYQKALAISDAKFETVFNLCPAALALRRLDNFRYVDVNEVWVALTGYSRWEAIGKTATELNVVDSFLLWEQKYGFSKSGTAEVDFRTKAGETRKGIWTFNVIELGGVEYILTSLIDITNNKQLEKELARLDRLNVIGDMAAGIGHELRNPLTTVRGFLQYFVQRGDYPRHAEVFELMIDELDRANSIISEFLALAKNRHIELERQSLNRIVSNLWPLIQAAAIREGKNTQLNLSGIPDVLVSENEIRQLLLNLTRNSLDAMEAGGSVIVETYRDDGGIFLAVRDSGPGMTPDILEKLGTPFFTTKANGAGLGLPICYRIAERHNARIEVETGPAGTSFVVRFVAPNGDGDG